MENINLWDLNLKECKYTNDINDIINKIIKGMEFTIIDSYTPGDEITNNLDIKADSNNTSLTYTDESHKAIIYNDSYIILNFKFYQENSKKIEEALYLKAKNKTYTNSKYIFGYKTKEDLENTTKLSISYEELLNEDINNLQCLKDNTLIDIGGNNNYDIDYNHEEKRLQNTKIFLDKLDKLNKNFIVNLGVRKRSNFEKTFKTQYQNLNLVINTDNQDYSYQKYMEGEKKLNELVAPIKNANLSPLEKYFAVYNIAKNFKDYKENENNKLEARNLRYILNNEYIVCVGFSNLLIALLDKVGINANQISVKADTSYDNGFTVEEKTVEKAGHARVIVNIDDDKYNVHGIYMADPTWDNNLGNNLLNHSLMTFDKMQISDRMFWQNTSHDTILDIHNFKEFNEQVNFLIKRAFKEEKENSYKKDDYNHILLTTYETVILNMIKPLSCDPEINKYYDILKNCKTEKDYIDLLTKMGNYLVERINKPIKDSIILKASSEYARQANDSRYIESKDYFEYENKAFPYIMTDDNHNLEDKPKSR